MGAGKDESVGIFEPLSKLLVSPLVAPMVVPNMIPYVAPFKQFGP